MLKGLEVRMVCIDSICQSAIWLFRKWTFLSLAPSSELFGNRDHAAYG